MKLTTILLLFFLVLPKTVTAQTVQGIVLDSATRDPLPYVHIGVVGKNVGVISRDDGTFHIDLHKTAPSDSLTFSLLGYRKQRLSPSEWKQGKLTVALSPRIYTLREIHVEDTRIDDPVKLGRHQPTKITTGYSGTGEFGFGGEWGIRINHDGQTYQIRDINLHTRFNTLDSVLFRFNIYSIQDNLPDTSLLSDEMFVTSHKRDRWITKDVTTERLVIDQDVIVTFEVVRLWYSATGSNALFYTHGEGYNQPDTYRRASSLDRWTVLRDPPITLYLTVDGYVP